MYGQLALLVAAGLLGPLLAAGRPSLLARTGGPISARWPREPRGKVPLGRHRRWQRHGPPPPGRGPPRPRWPSRHPGRGPAVEAPGARPRSRRDGQDRSRRRQPTHPPGSQIPGDRRTRRGPTAARGDAGHAPGGRRGSRAGGARARGRPARPAAVRAAGGAARVQGRAACPGTERTAGRDRLRRRVHRGDAGERPGGNDLGPRCPSARPSSPRPCRATRPARSNGRSRQSASGPSSRGCPRLGRRWPG